jgi:hypothetical protein
MSSPNCPKETMFLIGIEIVVTVHAEVSLAYRALLLTDLSFERLFRLHTGHCFLLICRLSVAMSS